VYSQAIAVQEEATERSRQVNSHQLGYFVSLATELTVSVDDPKC